MPVLKLPFIPLSHKQAGFSLIELIVAIIIVGTITVTASVKLLSVSTDAEFAQLEENASAFKQAVQFANTKWHVLGNRDKVRNLPGFSDGTLDINPNGYPIGTGKGRRFNNPFNIPNGHRGCVQLWTSLLEQAPSIAAGNNNSDYRAYRYRGAEGHNSMCDFVLRKLGDTKGRQRADFKFTYNSYTGTVTTTNNL